jgi:hypothetical protein
MRKRKKGPVRGSFHFARWRAPVPPMMTSHLWQDGPRLFSSGAIHFSIDLFFSSRGVTNEIARRPSGV